MILANVRCTAIFSVNEHRWVISKAGVRIHRQFVGLRLTFPQPHCAVVQQSRHTYVIVP
jgi:hypothetical protein